MSVPRSDSANPPDDAAQAAQAVSEDADLWIERYGDKLFCYAVRHVSQPDVAEDLVQETFLAAWRSRERFDGRSNFETWLIGILRHKIMDHLRQPRRESPLDPGGSGVSNEAGNWPFDEKGFWHTRPSRWSATEQAAENREFWAVLANCIGELPEHLAAAFRLREISTDTTEQICASLDVTPANLSVRLYRARVLLRGCLETRWFGGK